MGLEGLAMVSYPWQQNLPGWRVEFHDARAGFRGLTFPAERVIMIYVRQDLGSWSPQRRSHTSWAMPWTSTHGPMPTGMPGSASVG